jgi:hypothetical protein
MSLAKLLNQPLTLVKNNTASVDEYGNTIQGNGTTSTIHGYLEQTTSNEVLDDRDTVVSGWQVFLPADAVVTAFDRLVFAGKTFEVDGSPWSVYNPRVGSVSHIQANLKVVQ